ncbi:hypothetical protein GCM10027288_16190 [Bordetella tumbae]
MLSMGKSIPEVRLFAKAPLLSRCFYNNIHIDNTWSRGIGWTQNFGWNAGVMGARTFIRRA